MTGHRLAVVTGRPGDDNQGLRGGKAIRFLQVPTPSGQSIDYDIDTFRFVDASLLDNHSPSLAEHHRDHAVSIGRWIGQKYDRLALPDQVSKALNDSGIREALEKALKHSPDGILAVRVHLDETATIPVLTFLVIHDATGLDAATGVCSRIDTRATHKANVLDGRVTVASSHPISEDALKYGQWRKTRPWRVEYLSLSETPPAATPTQ